MPKPSFYKLLQPEVARMMDAIVRAAAEEVITKHVGYGIDSEIKQAIRTEAARLVKEDAKVRALIKARVEHWVEAQ